jgi:hypothetical protein
MLPGLCKLGCASNSAKPFFGSLSGARLRANGILTAMRPKDFWRELFGNQIPLSGKKLKRNLRLGCKCDNLPHLQGGDLVLCIFWYFIFL